MVGIAKIDVEVTLPLGINGGMVKTTVVGVGPSLVGSIPTVMCAVEKGPLEPGLVGLVEGRTRIGGERDTTSLSIAPPETG